MNDNLRNFVSSMYYLYGDYTHRDRKSVLLHLNNLVSYLIDGKQLNVLKYDSLFYDRLEEEIKNTVCRFKVGRYFVLLRLQSIILDEFNKQ